MCIMRDIIFLCLVMMHTQFFYAHKKQTNVARVSIKKIPRQNILLFGYFFFIIKPASLLSCVHNYFSIELTHFF